MKKNLKIAAIVVLLVLVISEIVVRLGLGFCHAVLFREDKDYEYIAIPQKTKRFGNNITYNSHSQRNGEISQQDSIIILGFGDSVINGGAQTDDDSLATTKLSEYLSQQAGKRVKVLNISAGSWGPDNCYQYLKKHGDFNARGILLILSSHDAYDNITHEKIVGVHPNYPDEQYWLAWAELTERYLIPRIRKKLNLAAASNSDNEGHIEKRTAHSQFNPGIEELNNYAKLKKVPLTIYLHADRTEYETKRYNNEGHKIERFCRQNHIPLVRELDYDIRPTSYRDGIHLSEKGQDAVFQILKNQQLY